MATQRSVKAHVVLLVALLITSLIIFLVPFTAHGADCPPKDKNGDGKKTLEEAAGDACTKGGQPGVCNAAGMCTLLGGGPMPMPMMMPMGMPPMLPMLPMPMGGGGDMPMMMPMGDCSQGGSPNAFKSASATSSPDGSGNCGGSSGGDTSSFPSFNIPDTSSGSGTGGSDVISSLLNGTIPANDNGGGSAETSSSGSSGGGATGVARLPFGSADGFSGDAQLRGNSFTLLISNRDASRGTQLSGFYGFTVANDATPLKVFQMLCAIRPWSSGFLSFIVSPIYFDNLCQARGLKVGVTSSLANPAGITSTSNPQGASNSAGVHAVQPPQPPTPPAQAGSAKADIWALPPTVAPGSRTSIFWQSTGVSSCSITSSENNFSGSSLSGHSVSPTLTKDTTFTISCLSATTTVSNHVVVTVQ